VAVFDLQVGFAVQIRRFDIAEALFGWMDGWMDGWLGFEWVEGGGDG